jgi:hypothetical protein
MMTLRKIFLSLLVAFSSLSFAQAQLSATISNQKDACDGLFNASFDLTVDMPGTTGPYTIFVFGLGFGMTDAESTPNAGVPVSIRGIANSGLRPDTYLVNVQDNDIATPNFTTFVTINNITPNMNVVVGPVINNTDCAIPNGSIALTSSGGTGSFSYAWTGPGPFSSTSEDITGLAGGSYSVVVSDNGTNCTRSPVPITITDPSPAIQTVTTPSPQIVCVGSNASITIAGTQVGVFYQVLVNGTPVGATVTNPLAPGPLTLPVSVGDIWGWQRPLCSGK